MIDPAIIESLRGAEVLTIGLCVDRKELSSPGYSRVLVHRRNGEWNPAVAVFSPAFDETWDGVNGAVIEGNGVGPVYVWMITRAVHSSGEAMDQIAIGPGLAMLAAYRVSPGARLHIRISELLERAKTDGDLIC